MTSVVPGRSDEGGGVDRELEAEDERVGDVGSAEGQAGLVGMEDILDIGRDADGRADLRAIGQLHHILVAPDVCVAARRDTRRAHPGHGQVGKALLVDDEADRVAVATRKGAGLDEAQLQVGFGKARLGQERFADAADHFQRGVELDPLSLDAWKGLGYCRHRLGELELARDAYVRARALAPTDELNQVNLALVLVELGDREGAEAELAELILRGSEYAEVVERALAR